MQVIATCEEGQKLHVEVTLTQGGVSGRRVGVGKCTGGIERYPVKVAAKGRSPFIEGPAEVEAVGRIRDRNLVVETQEWTRQVQLVLDPDDDDGDDGDEDDDEDED